MSTHEIFVIVAVALITLASLTWFILKSNRSRQKEKIADGLAVGYFFNFLKPLAEVCNSSKAFITEEGLRSTFNELPIVIHVLVPQTTEALSEKLLELSSTSEQVFIPRDSNRRIVVFLRRETNRWLLLDVPTILSAIESYRETISFVTADYSEERKAFLEVMNNLIKDSALPEEITIKILSDG